MTRDGRPLSGPAFPFAVVDGRVARSTGRAKVADDVRHLLSTRTGERALRRGYGGGVHHWLQEPSDHTLRALLRHEVEQALRAHLPALRLVGPIRVTATSDGLVVAFDYRLDPDGVVEHVEVATTGGAP